MAMEEAASSNLAGAPVAGPLIGPPPRPSGPSVIGGLSTVEVRWILPGPLDAAVVRWFGRFPAGLDSREDAYLIDPALRGLTAKIRAGQMLEVKQYHGSPGILDTADRARGRIESWRKWSFPFGPLGPGEAGPPGWAVVHKRRRMSRFRLVGGRLMADAAERAIGPECGVELTEIRLSGEIWWSLGFEASGPADLLRSTLEGTAALMFAQAPPGGVELDLSHCQSYAEWLSRHRAADAIHPPEDEESRRTKGKTKARRPAAVAYSRLHTGAHYLGDAVVGVRIGEGTGPAVAGLMDGLPPAGKSSRPGRDKQQEPPGDAGRH